MQREEDHESMYMILSCHDSVFLVAALLRWTTLCKLLPLLKERWVRVCLAQGQNHAKRGGQ